MTRAQQHVVQAGTAQFGFVNIPKVLYKFFREKEHARGLVERGEIRIGTLHEFRRTDGWDDLRGDAGEGEFTFSLSSASPETITAESAPWFIKPVIERVGMPIASHGGTLNAVANHPDAFMYCTTQLDSSQGPESYGEFGVVIHDVEAFFCLITEHLTDDLQVAAHKPHGFAAPCLYIDREVKLTSSQTEVSEPPFAFLKPAVKAAEREVRGIWHPITPPPVPRITVCTNLRDCCAWLET